MHGDGEARVGESRAGESRQYLLAFGSNEHAERAWDWTLARLPDLECELRWHSQPSLSAPEQCIAGTPEYLNALLVVSSRLPGFRFERALKALEQQAGARRKPWVPLDLDLLARLRSNGRLRRWPRRSLQGDYLQPHLAQLPAPWSALHAPT